MSKQTSKWLRDIFITPIIVGLIILIVGYFLPKFFSESKSLSYLIEPSLVYFDRTSIGSTSVKINENPVSEVFTSKVKIWNSGDIPLKDIPIRFEFSSPANDLKILAVNHNTQPVREFGAIKEDGSEGSSKRYIFQLLNPKDEDTLVFLTSAQSELKVYSKAEGLKLIEIKPDKSAGFNWLTAALIAMLASLSTSVINIITHAYRSYRQKVLTHHFQQTKSLKDTDSN